MLIKQMLLGISSIVVGGGAIVGVYTLISGNMDTISEYASSESFQNLWKTIKGSSEFVKSYVSSDTENAPNQLTAIAEALKMLYSNKDNIYQLIQTTNIHKQFPKLVEILKDPANNKELYELFSEENKDKALKLGRVLCGLEKEENVTVEDGVCAFLLDKLLNNPKEISQRIKEISKDSGNLQDMVKKFTTSNPSSGTTPTVPSDGQPFKIDKNLLTSILDSQPSSSAPSSPTTL